MSFCYELACKGHSTEKAQDLVKQHNDLSCFTSLTFTLYLKRSFFYNFPTRTGVNKKVVGKLKDDTVGKQIQDFVALRPKLYSYKIANEDHRKCKGTKKNVVDKTITHENYVNCLVTQKPQMRKMFILRSDMHIYTEEIAFSADDDKRIIMENGISTLAYGHYNVPPISNG